MITLQCCIPTRVGISEEELERNASAKRKVNENLFEAYPSGQPSIAVNNLRKVFRSLTGTSSNIFRIYMKSNLQMDFQNTISFLNAVLFFEFLIKLKEAVLFRRRTSRRKRRFFPCV